MKPNVDMMLRQPMPPPQVVHGPKAAAIRGAKEWAALRYQHRVTELGGGASRGIGPGMSGAQEVEEDIRLRRLALGDEAAALLERETEANRPSAAALLRQHAPLALRSTRRAKPKLLRALPGWVESDLVSLQAGNALLKQIKEAAGPAKVIYAGSSKGPRQARRPRTSAASEYTTDDEDIVLEARVPQELLDKAGMVGRLRVEDGKRRGNLVAHGISSPNSKHVRKAARAGRKRGMKTRKKRGKRSSKFSVPATGGEVIFDESQLGPQSSRPLQPPPRAGSSAGGSRPGSKSGSRASRRGTSRGKRRPGTRGTESTSNSSQLGKDLWGNNTGGNDGLDGAMGAIVAAASELHGVFDPDNMGGSLDDLIGPGSDRQASAAFDEDGDTSDSSGDEQVLLQSREDEQSPVGTPT